MKVGWDERALLLDGERTFLLSGAIHYPRSTPEMWPGLMREARAAGLNAVETYVFWNLHERVRGVYDFTDRLDLVRFIETAAGEGLHVVLRIGPYICAETNFGGLPAWLREVPGMRTRTINGPFQAEMQRFVMDIADLIEPYTAQHGGPIIAGQIENEFNLVRAQKGQEGIDYLAWSISLARRLELDIPWVMCVGGAPGAIETLNAFHAHEGIADHRLRNPNMPLLWTECWTGWYDTWGSPHRVRRAANLAYAVARFVAGGGTGINYYMWHGGTNFGRETMYLQTTTYDYDAPLDEFGRPTGKARHLAALHAALAPHAASLLDSAPVEVRLTGSVSAFESGALAIVCNDGADRAEVQVRGHRLYLEGRSAVLLDGETVVFDSALAAEPSLLRVTGSRPVGPFRSADLPLASERTEEPAHVGEAVDQLVFTRDETDYCWYSTGFTAPGPGLLTLNDFADAAQILVDDVIVGSTTVAPLERRGPYGGSGFQQSFMLDIAAGDHRLDILASAIGLIKGDWMIGDRDMVEERKGLCGAATFDGLELGPWTMRSRPRCRPACPPRRGRRRNRSPSARLACVVSSARSGCTCR